MIAKKHRVALDEALDHLADKINKHVGEHSQLETPIPNLKLTKFEGPTQPTGYIHQTSLCMIAQGAKAVRFKNMTYDYNRSTFLITPLDLPVEAHITEASEEKPYLGLSLVLDQKVVSQLILECHYKLDQSTDQKRIVATGEVDLTLVNAVTRLIDLMDTPGDIPVIQPLIYKEILYRILNSSQGTTLFQMGIVGTRSHQISKAIEWLKRNFDKSFRIEELAEMSGMSSTTLHHHFKDLTDMSPLQYQKWLRLSEARRLMITEMLDASSASFRVGYESPSQFSREYSRLFGNPPSRDIKQLRQYSFRESA